MTHDETPSSNDDGLRETCAPEIVTGGANETKQPWWADDPAIAAAREEVEQWLEAAEAEPIPDDNFSAIHDEVSSGSCKRELRRARQDLERAQVRYADAVRTARALGYSWGEIGQLLGVPRQLLHRRYRYEVD
jgi:DNA-directed RNA polymerase specialized sigma24 family protein